jgi:uncharacterized protein (TIGR03067 family)
MRLARCGATWFAAFLLIAAGKDFYWGEAAADDKGADYGITGSWRANAATIIAKKGEKKTLAISEQQPLGVIVSDKTLTMRLGDKNLAEMPYMLDSKQMPRAIDLTFQGQDMAGIYELKGDRLRISLSEAKNERPKDFGAAGSDMDLLLHRFQGEPLMVINADGSDLHALLSMPEYTSCGSPQWSVDGSKIVFDAWRSVYGENYRDSHILVVNADGTSPADLGDGTLPSWSPDGKQIAYSRYSPNGGIWAMKADGTDTRSVNTDAWCASWSPKSNELAYTISKGDGWDICVHDSTTQKQRFLLDEANSEGEAAKITGIIGSLYWSPDGQWICFRGRLSDESSEVVIINAQGQSKGFRILLSDKSDGVKELNNYFSWSPDGKQILAPLRMEGNTNLQLYFLDPDAKTPPRKLAGLDPSVRYYGSSWSADGKKIVLVFWPGAAAR